MRSPALAFGEYLIHQNLRFWSPVSLRLGHAAALTATGCHSLPRRRFATSGGRLGGRQPSPKGAETPNGRCRDIGAPPRLRDSVRLRLSARSAPLPLLCGTGRARQGKVFHKRKTVGFPLVWRSFRPFLSTWREKDIPFAAGEPHPPLTRSPFPKGKVKEAAPP